MYLSSVLGISLSKVCKVVLSPCLCINKYVCHNLKCFHYTFHELTKTKTALSMLTQMQRVLLVCLWTKTKLRFKNNIIIKDRNLAKVQPSRMSKHGNYRVGLSGKQN